MQRDQCLKDEVEEKSPSVACRICTAAWRLLGAALMVAAAFHFAWITNETHESMLFFSNIKEVEREISLRTEQGLYYSYYKQLLLAGSLPAGLRNLLANNATEHPDTINVVRRMNVYQEILLAALYRCTAVRNYLQPMYFYIYSVLFLNGLLVCGLFAIAWLLTGSPLAGCLAAVMYGSNSAHTTRLSSTHALREHFALPFLWLQIYFFSLHFGAAPGRWPRLLQRIALPAGRLCTLLFALFWQFNQFVLLLQSLSVLAATVIGFLPFRKAYDYFVTVAVSLLAVSALQLGNPMPLTSPALSLSLSAAVTVVVARWRLRRLGDSPFGRLCRCVCQCWCCLLLCAACHLAVKLLVPHEADSHVYKFVMMKLGYGYDDDFDVRMYNCAGAFVWLPWETFADLGKKLLLQPYLLAHAALFLLTFFGFFAFLRRGRPPAVASVGDSSSICSEVLDNFARRPEFAFHAVQATVFGILGYTTLRMKYFWTPYMCVLAPLPAGHGAAWRWLLGKVRIRLPLVGAGWSHAVTLALLVSACLTWHRESQSIWQDLREFWDPDTVQLMQWIQNSTPPEAAFTGSMQLLAGVKCCTERRITNHPHYEDQELRLKTRRLYQIYGRKPPEEVHSILKSFSTDYIILEDSICLRPGNGCGTTELVDNLNSELTDLQLQSPPGQTPPGLRENPAPRFCDEIRRWHGNEASPYGRLFRLVLHNRTFRVYRVV